MRRPRFLRSGKATAGALILLFFFLFAIIGPWVAPYSPDATGALPVAGPSGAHWFGTDQLGRDIFARVVYGARQSLFLGIGSSVAGGAVVAAWGLVAGLGGPAID